MKPLAQHGISKAVILTSPNLCPSERNVFFTFCMCSCIVDKDVMSIRLFKTLKVGWQLITVCTDASGSKEPQSRNQQ